MAFVIGEGEKPPVEVISEPSVSPEVLTTPETVEAQPVEAVVPAEMPAVVEVPIEQVPASVPVATPVASNKSETMVKIEKILEDDLTEVYKELPEKEKTRFRAESEKVATQLELLITKAKLTAQTAILILRNWLRGLPGVGQFFIEQVVKIKADRLLDLMNQMKHVLG